MRPGGRLRKAGVRMSGEWHSRAFGEGDDREVLRLRVRVMGDIDPVRLQERTWRWQFAENPAGPPVCRLAEDRDRVVGQYVVIPVRMRIAGEERTWFFSCDTMVDPDYRRRGIFTDLAREVFESVESDYPGASVWGFPNGRSVQAFTGKLGWKVLTIFPVRLFLLHPARALMRRMFIGKSAGRITAPAYQTGISMDFPSTRLVPVGRFGREWDAVWENHRDMSRVMQIRDSLYYNWRYLEGPDFGYRPYYVNRRGEIEGVIVLREVCLEGFRLGALVEMFPFPVVDKDLSREILLAVIRHFRDRRMDFVSALVSTADDEFFAKSGFRILPEKLNPRTWYFGGRFSGADHPANSIENWYLTYGDADIV